MANPQIENGYTRIANELLDSLLKTNLSAYQSRILWAIMRKTFGFQKKEDRIPLSQLVMLTGLRKQHVWRTFRELRDRNLVTKRGYFVAFNKDYQQWRELPKGVTSHKSNQRGLPELPKGVTKSNLRGLPQKKKETLQKKVILRDSKKPNPAIKEFLTFWNKAFSEKTGKDYFFNGGKEGALTKKMLESYSLDNLKELAGVFFESHDNFILTSGYTIGVFHSQLNKLSVEKGGSYGGNSKIGAKHNEQAERKNSKYAGIVHVVGDSDQAET